MKIRITHPLWTHLPVLGLLLYLAVRLITAGPLPASAPIHFGFNGTPDAFGSPWLAFGLTLGLVVLFGGLSIIFDESWVRNEKRKSFNWISLLDEITAAVLVAVAVGYLDYLKSGAATFTFPFALLALTVVIAVALGVVLEWLRPFHLNPQAVILEDTSILEKDLQQKLKGSPGFVYWQSQNPGWLRILTILLPVIFIVTAVLMWDKVIWMSVLFGVIALSFSLLDGGMRTIVTRHKITLLLGPFNIRLLTIKTSEIVAAELLQFSPIKDFGGYGIRFNGKMYAYYWRGNRGVKVTLIHGMQYLIGADHPEQMLAVIKAVSGQSGGG